MSALPTHHSVRRWNRDRIQDPKTVTRVIATHEPTEELFMASTVPGVFHVTEPDDHGKQFFWYKCPCGCPRMGKLHVGTPMNPAAYPAFNWNGSRTRPELTELHVHPNHWRGWLRDGVWESC